MTYDHEKLFKEESAKYPHIKISDVYLLDEKTNTFNEAHMDLFGHCCEASVYLRKNTERVRITMSPDYELIYKILEEKTDKTIISIFGDCVYSVPTEKVNLITNHFNEMNKLFIEDRKKFKNQVEIEVEALLCDIELNRLTDNYFKSISQKYFIDPKIIWGIEYELVIKNKIGDMLLISDENSRDSLVQITKKQNRGTIKTYAKLENQDVVNLFMKDFDLFVKLMIQKNNYTDYEFSKFVSYRFLLFKAIKYFSTDWDKEYHEYFLDIDEISLEKAIKNYCYVDVVEPLDLLTAAKFIYFLMDNNKFGNPNVNYLEAYDRFVSICFEALENKKAADFETTLNTLDTVTYTINDIDLMSGSEFENFISLLFTKMGYQCIVTKHSGDQGIDVIAEKNSRKMGIQAKCYSHQVTNSAIQEVVAGLGHYNLSKGLVVTNHYFTNSAIELAQSNEVILWDRNLLKEKINEIFSK